MSTPETGGGALAAFSSELADAVERAGRSVVAIHARRRIPSSGVVWRPGVVVATHHTIRRDEDIRVTLPDGSTVGADLAGRDPGTDLAVLRLREGGAEPAERGDTAELRVGHLVLAVGRPGEGGVTASLGAVSAVGGEWRTWSGGRMDRLVRLDLAVRDGFSGGPLVDARGRVVGINTSALARGAALTIPLSTVERVAEQLLSRGRVARGYLGVGTQPVRVPATVRTAAGTAAEVGLMVVHVAPGGPAEQGGVLMGDVVLELDGTPVADAGHLAALLGGDRIGQAIPVRVLRAGETATLSVVVGERPEPRGA
ncbi:MAG TPA: trypsin-like peptidase domain-containing protein [Longimicrobiaceae bacterium]|jgi:S1-C subfamily serine protease